MAEQDKIQQFFMDPQNLATGLVFLAALSQPRQRGQSSVGKVAQSAAGAFGFRGGLQQGMRKNAMEDEEQRARRLEESRQEEARQRSSKAQQQGLGLQERQLTQAERLAKEGREHEVKLKGMPDALTPEQKKVLTSQAGYYDRMPRETAGAGSDASLRNKLFEDAFRLHWEQEVKNAALEGRQPDITRTIPQLSNLMAGISALPMGLKITRREDGTLGIEIPGAPGAPLESSLEPFATTPQRQPVPQLPSERSPAALIGGAAASGVAKLLGAPPNPNAELERIARDPNATPEQRVAARNKLREQAIRKVK
jgi:hypothetical protein